MPWTFAKLKALSLFRFPPLRSLEQFRREGDTDTRGKGVRTARRDISPPHSLPSPSYHIIENPDGSETWFCHRCEELVKWTPDLQPYCNCEKTPVRQILPNTDDPGNNIPDECEHRRRGSSVTIHSRGSPGKKGPFLCPDPCPLPRTVCDPSSCSVESARETIRAPHPDPNVTGHPYFLGEPEQEEWPW